jgi:hypothetical protein
MRGIVPPSRHDLISWLIIKHRENFTVFSSFIVHGDSRFLVETLGAVEGEVVPGHIIKAYRGSRGVALTTHTMEQSPS